MFQSDCAGFIYCGARRAAQQPAESQLTAGGPHAESQRHNTHEREKIALCRVGLTLFYPSFLYLPHGTANFSGHWSESWHRAGVGARNPGTEELARHRHLPQPRDVSVLIMTVHDVMYIS